MSAGPIRWVGSRAVMVECDTLADVLALHRYLLDTPLPGQIDLVPAAKTLLIKCDSHRNAMRAHAAIAHIEAPPIEHGEGKTIEIEVVYDGEDLESVGELTGLGVDGVIEAHTAQAWRAAFSGFAPGFVYLAAENDALDVPRRDSPRTAVPAGSVALAGGFSAVYPRRSPGGWQLIGRTNTRAWDIKRDEPALIQAGDLVRFKAVDRLEDKNSGAGSTPHEEAGANAAEPAIEIVNAGMQSLVEDLGRPGLSHLGVSISGAADEAAARQANRLVGNSADKAVIETLLGGLTIRAHGDMTLARAGAEADASITSDRAPRRAPMRTPFALHDGETLTLAAPSRGLRHYIAARGGLDVPPVLDSRATDAMSGIGPEPLAAGTLLPVGVARPSHIVGAAEPSTLAQTKDETVLRVMFGPRHDWFSPQTCHRFLQQRWLATDQSNRIGVRLTTDENDDDAAVLERHRAGELASEGTVPGALQVPPSGLPVLFLKDHPVTGGYPVIAVVIAEDLPIAAQLRPGEAVRFMAVSPQTLAPIDNADADSPVSNTGTPP